MAKKGCEWRLQHHYHCAACGWRFGPQSEFPEEPKTCPCCGANPDGSNPWPPGTAYHQPAHGWTCFHCGETFRVEAAARIHFGASPEAEPGCMLKVRCGEEHALLATLREAEEQLARYAAEDTDLHREIARLEADHATALRREEETGYARGRRDERSRSLRIIARVKAGLRTAAWLKADGADD